RVARAAARFRSERPCVLISAPACGAASCAEPDGVAPRVQSTGDGVERESDATLALVGRHGVEQIARKQYEVAGCRRGTYPPVGVERRRCDVGVLVPEDELGAS